MTRLKAIRIEGFRGVSKSLTVNLDGQSLAIYGENGFIQIGSRICGRKTAKRQPCETRSCQTPQAQV